MQHVLAQVPPRAQRRLVAPRRLPAQLVHPRRAAQNVAVFARADRGVGGDQLGVLALHVHVHVVLVAERLAAQGAPPLLPRERLLVLLMRQQPVIVGVQRASARDGDAVRVRHVEEQLARRLARRPRGAAVAELVLVLAAAHGVASGASAARYSVRTELSV